MKNTLRSFPAGLVVALAAGCLSLFAVRMEAPFAFAQGKRAPEKQARYRSRSCGQGVELRLSAPAAAQGSLLLVEVRSAKPLAEIKGEWSGRELEFWRENARGEGKKGGGRVVREDWRRALLGVDLERAAGKYELTVAAQTEDGKPVSCKAMVAVRTGRFATERLQVEQQFVEPDAEQLRRAEQERERLRTLFATVTPERMWQGGFRVPLDGVSTGGNFGRRRILNGHPGLPHTGVDFPAVAGTPVHAAQQGRVVLAEDLFFSGNTVVVDHGLGIYTFYGHLETISVQAGDRVEAGVLLGNVGTTGRVTGPHLHWGLTVTRARVNPLEIVALLGKE